EGRRPFTDRELLANAFDLAREIHLHHRRPAHSAQVLASLSRHESPGPLVEALRQTLEEGVSEPPLLPGPLRRLQRRTARWYLELVRSRRLHQAVVLLFVLYAVFVATSLTAPVTGWWSAPLTGPGGVARAGALAADLLSLVLLAVGGATLRRSRVGAHRWVEPGGLVHLLVSPVFPVFLQQFIAISGLAIDLILLLVVNGMIRSERTAHHEARRAVSAHPAH